MFFRLLFLSIFIFVVLPAVVSFIKMLFGNSGKANQSRYQHTHDHSQQHTASDHKKVFDRSEGEYVDYEEVK